MSETVAVGPSGPQLAHAYGPAAGMTNSCGQRHSRCRFPLAGRHVVAPLACLPSAVLGRMQQQRAAIAMRAGRSRPVGAVLAKLGLRDRVQVVVFAYECGIVEPGARSDPRFPAGRQPPA